MSKDELVSLATGGKVEVQKYWMPTTALRPLVFHDPATIWLDHYGEANGFKPDSSPYDFLPFIGEKGRQFEEKWAKEFAENSVVVCAQDYEVRFGEKLCETIEHLYSGAPVIIRPALWWAAERIYGVPDLIVHTSWLAERFQKLIPQFEDESPATTLPQPSKPGHYVVLDIKFTTGLDESAKKEDYANYAAQVRIYSYMLGQLQGLMPRHAYLVTQDRVFDPLPVKIVSSLGQPLDADLTAMRDHFLEIKLYGSKYRPWTDSIVDSNLPHEDEKWATAKEVIAHEKFPGRDPALLYQVSLSIRNELKALAFPSLDSMLAADPALVPLEKCKGIGPKKSKVMRVILEANRSGKLIKPTAATIPPMKRNEFFVDFEYLTNVNIDFERQWPTLEGQEMVFMLGVGRNTNAGWAFGSFVAVAENSDAEKKMFTQFVDFLSRETQGVSNGPY